MDEEKAPACIPFFVHENCMMHYNAANRRMLIALVTVCITFVLTIVIFVVGYHDVVSYVGDKYSELARDVAGLAVQNAQTIANQNECCCSTKLLITETTGNLAAQIAQNKYENALALAGMEQRITAKMDANEITALRDQVQQLQLAQATAGVLRYPTTWTYAAGQFPPVAGTAA